MTTTMNRTELVTPIIQSLNAKIEHLLAHPLAATIVRNTAVPEDVELGVLGEALLASGGTIDWSDLSELDAIDDSESEDDTCTLRVQIDYDRFWKDREDEVRRNVTNSVESLVLLLTREQHALLMSSPRTLLEGHQRPDAAELIGFEADRHGRVIGLTLAERPLTDISHVAIIPNLVQLQRQLDAICLVAKASDDGPLAPLRALAGLCELPDMPEVIDEPATVVGSNVEDRLDEHQERCVDLAMRTPHFAVIQGPPGSGKTTVISRVIRRELDRGGRVLVVSPTHVAVDNVVEKLVRLRENEADTLEAHSLPARFAAKKNKLSDDAVAYWTGPRSQHRADTITDRLHKRMAAVVPGAANARAEVDTKIIDCSPVLSSCIASMESVICGTPIGILSHNAVQDAAPAAFDLLIVDEVSKLTLPEFLAIAVKARRWVLVGDPKQLPPYNDCEANGVTLDDLLTPTLELVCSAAAVLERAKPDDRVRTRLVVVTDQPDAVHAALGAHLRETGVQKCPRIDRGVAARSGGGIVVVCGTNEVEQACDSLRSTAALDRNGDRVDRIELLVQRGMSTSPEWVTEGVTPVDVRRRAAASIFDVAYTTFHAQPWTKMANQKLDVVAFRNGLNKSLPSRDAVELLRAGDAFDLTWHIALRFAVNTVSAYEWLAGMPTEDFDVSPLQELADMANESLTNAMEPWCGTLELQYRMSSRLSQVPRKLFYFGRALHDGPLVKDVGGVKLVDVAGSGLETNRAEADRILATIETIRVTTSHVMIITPYLKQQQLLRDCIDASRRNGRLKGLNVEVLTMDSCQGKEADLVIISLVRSRASPFLNNPKRWNVALTRAKRELVIVGDIRTYLQEARAANHHRGDDGRARMSLPARLIHEYSANAVTIRG